MTAPRTDEVPLWNIANILTMVRCAMVPLLVVLAILYPDSVPGRLVVTAVFVFATFTIRIVPAVSEVTAGLKLAVIRLGVGELSTVYGIL